MNRRVHCLSSSFFILSASFKETPRLRRGAITVAPRFSFSSSAFSPKNWAVPRDTLACHQALPTAIGSQFDEKSARIYSFRTSKPHLFPREDLCSAQRCN